MLPLIRAYYRHDGICFHAARMTTALCRLLREPSLGQIWTVEAGSKTAGHVMLTYNFDLEFGGMQGMITDLFIKAQYRGKGLGSAALVFVEAFCRQQEIEEVELQVTGKNRAARAFYRKMGFVVKDRTVLG
ncbi:MAG: GNAT family N-acetyltransferase [Terriglobales bacterium]